MLVHLNSMKKNLENQMKCFFNIHFSNSTSMKRDYFYKISQHKKWSYDLPHYLRMKGEIVPTGNKLCVKNKHNIHVYVK
jgi:hypothetical protein